MAKIEMQTMKICSTWSHWWLVKKIKCPLTLAVSIVTPYTGSVENGLLDWWSEEKGPITLIVSGKNAPDRGIGGQ